MIGERELRNYWVERLSQDLGASNLILDYQRPRVEAGERACIPLNLTVEIHQKLDKLTDGGSFLLYTTLLAALKICLHKYTGSTSIVVGSPSRKLDDDSEQEANVLPIVDVVDTQISFRQFLLNVRQTLLEAYARQRYPFERLVKDLDMEAVDGGCPLFDIVIALEDIHCEIPRIGNDITMRFKKQPGGISGSIEYDTFLFRDESIERFRAHFFRTLEAVLGDINVRICDLDILSDSERNLLLSEWNNTQVDYGASACIHQLFEEQVKRTPDALALVFESEQLTYHELNVRANQFAHYLRASGVGPEVRVAVCTERSLEMMVCLLGVMKAGGAYVFLDPGIPLLRLHDIVNDTAPHVIIVQKDMDRFENRYAKTIVLESVWQEVKAHSSYDPLNISRPENLLTIVYTSASTGVPKGTMITIDSVLNRLHWMWETYPFRPGDVTILQKSIALVGTLGECFGGLLKGIPTVILPRVDLLDPLKLWRKLVDQRISYLLASPALLQGVIQEGERHRDEESTLRVATTSAEPVSPAIVARWNVAFPEAPLLNLYGATECSSNVTLFDTTKMHPNIGRVPVGRPLSNTQIYVLDERLNPVQTGGMGEMCLSGVSLARGYLKLPSLTADRFVPHPFSTVAGSRLCRTGDLARYGMDENLDLVGRKDHQVKVRGFRVEIGDIEATLLRHDEVRRCAVTLCGNGSGDKFLAAYVESGDDLSIDSLRKFLRERLPGYMVPTSFVRLEALPLTPSGKVDRRALPPPEGLSPAIDAAFVAPRTEEERIICGILEEVLHIERVGTNIHFMDLGLHSLLMIQVQSSLGRALDREIPIIDLLTHSTVSSLAEHLRCGPPEETSFEQAQYRAERRKAMRTRMLDRRKRKSSMNYRSSDEQ